MNLILYYHGVELIDFFDDVENVSVHDVEVSFYYDVPFVRNYEQSKCSNRYKI